MIPIDLDWDYCVDVILVVGFLPGERRNRFDGKSNGMSRNVEQ